VPTLVRVAVGVAVEAAFLLWLIGRGRLAVADGFSGLPADDDAAWEGWRASGRVR
jgi:hypothetical protein